MDDYRYIEGWNVKSEGFQDEKFTLLADAMAHLPESLRSALSKRDGAVLVRCRTEADIAALPPSIAAALKQAAAICVNGGRIEMSERALRSTSPTELAKTLAHEFGHHLIGLVPKDMLAAARSQAAARGEAVIVMANRRTMPEGVEPWQLKGLKSSVNAMLRKGVSQFGAELALMLPDESVGRWLERFGMDRAIPGGAQYDAVCVLEAVSRRRMTDNPLPNADEELVTYLIGADPAFADAVFSAVAGELDRRAAEAKSLELERAIGAGFGSFYKTAYRLYGESYPDADYGAFDDFAVACRTAWYGVRETDLDADRDDLAAAFGQAVAEKGQDAELALDVGLKCGLFANGEKVADAGESAAAMADTFLGAPDDPDVDEDAPARSAWSGVKPYQLDMFAAPAAPRGGMRM